LGQIPVIPFVAFLLLKAAMLSGIINITIPLRRNLPISILMRKDYLKKVLKKTLQKLNPGKMANTHLFSSHSVIITTIY